MAEFVKRAAQSLLVWAIVAGALYVVWSPALRLPQLWMLAAVTVLANVFQPSYQPFEGSRTPEDRGTAVQILWTVAVTQGAALVELVVRKAEPPLDAVSWAAFGVMAAGLGLRTWAVYTLGRWFTWNVAVQDGQTLVERGPYRMIRHPSYTGALLTFAAAPLLLHAWVTFALAVVALPAAFLRRIRHEEHLMRETFVQYEAYAARTGALFPRI